MMNWGRSIVVVLVLFMGFISILAIKMINSQNDAFDKDYYEKGLAFDKEYRLKQNVIDDHVTPEIVLNDSLLVIDFIAVDEGVIQFKRPSDQKQDRKLHLKTSRIVVPRKDLAKGEWHLVMNWNVQQKHYRYEKSLFIP